ncbi:MAG: IS630 family transposase, partial [Nitrospirota bacterium]
ILIYGDEAGVTLDSTITTVWGIKGKQPVISSISGRGRVHLVGFVEPESGNCNVYRAERGNSDNFLLALNRLYELYKYVKQKVILVVDNARWHHAKRVKEWISKHPLFELIYLPPYSPDLNPMERQWWYMRKRATHTILFDTLEECWNRINNHFLSMTKEQVVTLCQID